MLDLPALRQRLTEHLPRLKEPARELLIPGLTFVVLVILTAIFSAGELGGGPIRLSDFAPGGVAPRDVVADRDIEYVDEIATAQKLEAAQELTPQIFRVNDEITRLALERYAQFEKSFLALFREEGSVETAFLRMQLVVPVTLTREELAKLNTNPIVEDILRVSREILADFLDQGIVAPTAELSEAGLGTIDVWRWRSGKLERTEMAVSRLLTIEALPARLDNALRSAGFTRSGEAAELARGLVTAFARENVFVDVDETRRARERARAAVTPEMERLVRGQSIVRKGDLLTDVVLARLRAMGAHRVTVGANTILGAALMFLLMVALAVYLLHRGRTGQVLTRPEVIFLCVSAVVYALAALLERRFLANAAGLPLSVYLPTATVAILVALVLSPGVAVGYSVCLAGLLLAIGRLDVGSFLFALLSAIAGIGVATRAATRIDLIRAGLFLSLLSLPVLLAIGFLTNATSGWFAAALVAAAVNGFFCGVLALGLLPILEHTLNTATRFRLLELSDVNSPILKRMLTLAPGTYSHSLAVANLAESACNEIGANHLLARVGAYYHDIGKIEQAEYFAENQTSENKHDELAPSLSVAVIKSHVKIGVEKGKELALPEEVVDIIAQHHGRDLIKYFYHRARTGPEGVQVSTGDYSYRGTRPRSREAAVVMLADAVEATTRLLKRPSVAKLEKTVWDSIMERFSRGELSESALTFRDLEVIKSSFVRVLAGHFHSRIEYPRVAEGTR